MKTKIIEKRLEDLDEAPSGIKLSKSKEPDLLGAHMSTSGGVQKAIERACSIGCTAMQIFVKNNMQWFAAPLSEAFARAFCGQSQASCGKQLLLHHALVLVSVGA